MRRPAPGFSLLEVMIALAVLSVGLLGMMQFQILGITANAAGRRHTAATGIAQELLAGIERLPFGDDHIAVTSGDTGPGAPTPFGRLVAGNTLTATDSWQWSDEDPVPGVRLASEIGPEFERRWTVWGYTPTPGGVPVVKIVAVSVVYHERGLGTPREVVLYTQLNDPSTLISNLPANQ